MSGDTASNNHDRYSRQIRFREIGVAGQLRLAQSRVAIIGCGALGSMQAELLARAGVGFLRLIDRDYVEWSNLQRQALFDEKDAEAALPKAAAAVARLKAVNSNIEYESAICDLTPDNADDLLEDVHLIMDGTDNFETRYLINDFALLHNIPWIYGAAVGSYGLKTPVLPGKTCCLRCMMPEPPEDSRCLERRYSADAAACSESLLSRLRSPRVFVFCLAKRTPIALCGRNAVQIYGRARNLDLKELARRIEPLGRVKVSEFAFRAQIEKFDITVFPDGRAILMGTTDVGVACGLYLPKRSFASSLRHADCKQMARRMPT